MFIQDFLHFLHNYTNLYFCLGSLLTTVAHYMLSSTDLMTSDNMYNLILTIFMGVFFM